MIAHSPLPSGYLSDSNPYPTYPYSDMATYTLPAVRLCFPSALSSGVGLSMIGARLPRDLPS